MTDKPYDIDTMQAQRDDALMGVRPEPSTDVFIEQCVVDGGELIKEYGADERGPYTWFQCKINPQHAYRTAYDGMRWSPVDSGDYC